MPSFGGSAIFGRGVTIVTGDLIQQRQTNEFPGLNGIESLTMGSRGLMTQVKGTLFAANSALLSTAEAIFRSYRDGNAYQFVDNYGATWNNVVLDSYEPQGRVSQTPDGFYLRSYIARFQHLSAF
jgi:hypothetical protein